MPAMLPPTSACHRMAWSNWARVSKFDFDTRNRVAYGRLVPVGSATRRPIKRLPRQGNPRWRRECSAPLPARFPLATSNLEALGNSLRNPLPTYEARSDIGGSSQNFYIVNARNYSELWASPAFLARRTQRRRLTSDLRPLPSALCSPPPITDHESRITDH
jgi:hypothetical protein